ncbi:toprim domain-containing protein [Bradyrhizobium elkanii]
MRRDGIAKADIEKPKIIVGRSSLPIIISPVSDLLGLAVVEGIEDGLSVHQATGLGVWAAGAANRIPALAAVIPDYIETLTIYADDDDAGQDNARKLAAGLRGRHIEIVIEGAL